MADTDSGEDRPREQSRYTECFIFWLIGENSLDKTKSQTYFY